MSKRPAICPECGCFLDRFSLPRSPKQHKAFFQMIKVALDNWPESHSFRPVGIVEHHRQEHLRAWLLTTAGHKLVSGERLSRDDARDWDRVARFVAVALQPTPLHPYKFLREDHNGDLVVDMPKSIDWYAVSHEEFKPIFDEVLFIIEREIGIKVEFIKKEVRFSK